MYIHAFVGLECIKPTKRLKSNALDAVVQMQMHLTPHLKVRRRPSAALAGVMTRSSSKSPRWRGGRRGNSKSPRVKPAGNDDDDDADDDGVAVAARPVKMTAVPSIKTLETPKDLQSALREIDRLRSAQEKSAASAMAATRRALDEQRELEKRAETLEAELERAKESVEETKKHAEREIGEAKKSAKTAKKKAQKLEGKLEEQKEVVAKWERYASENLQGEIASSAEKLERASKKEIELEDRCARQYRVVESMKGQIEELRTTLEDERERGSLRTGSQASEIQRLEAELSEALKAAANAKEEADMTVESMKLALEAQMDAGGDEGVHAELERLRARVEELSAAPSTTSQEDLDKMGRLEEKLVALERVLEGERASKSARRRRRLRNAPRRLNRATIRVSSKPKSPDSSLKSSLLRHSSQRNGKRTITLRRRRKMR